MTESFEEVPLAAFGSVDGVGKSISDREETKHLESQMLSPNQIPSTA